MLCNSMSKYHERIARGVCGECGANSIKPPMKRCDRCLERLKKAQQKHRDKLKSDSLCYSCKVPLEKSGYCQSCREVLKVANKKLGPEYHRQTTKKSREKLRLDVVTAYGGKCKCCGVEELVFLTIDHIDGNGGQHRKELGSNTAVYAWLRQNNYPEGFQVLCWNCNWAKWHGGCPHQTK